MEKIVHNHWTAFNFFFFFFPPPPHPLLFSNLSFFPGHLPLIILSHCFLLAYPSSAGSHLLVGDGDETLFGEFPQRVDICPHVQLTAHQHHFGVGTKLLRLPLPLWKHEKYISESAKCDSEATCTDWCTEIKLRLLALSELEGE